MATTKKYINRESDFTLLLNLPEGYDGDFKVIVSSCGEGDGGSVEGTRVGGSLNGIEERDGHLFMVIRHGQLAPGHLHIKTYMWIDNSWVEGLQQMVQGGEDIVITESYTNIADATIGVDVMQPYMKGDKGDMPETDTELNENSDAPIANRAVFEALSAKLDKVVSLVQINTPESALYWSSQTMKSYTTVGKSNVWNPADVREFSVNDFGVVYGYTMVARAKKRAAIVGRVTNVDEREGQVTMTTLFALQGDLYTEDTEIDILKTIQSIRHDLLYDYASKEWLETYLTEEEYLKMQDLVNDQEMNAALHSGITASRVQEYDEYRQVIDDLSESLNDRLSDKVDNDQLIETIMESGFQREADIRANLAEVAKSGSYNDLKDVPTMPDAYTKDQSDRRYLQADYGNVDGNVCINGDLEVDGTLTNALGEEYLTEHQDISGKQDVIADLDTIRSGAALGATALQEHQSLEGYAKTDAIPTKTSQLTNDSGFLTEHQDISGKADKSYVDEKVDSKLTEADEAITEVKSAMKDGVKAVISENAITYLNNAITEQVLTADEVKVGSIYNGRHISDPGCLAKPDLIEVNVSKIGIRRKDGLKVRITQYDADGKYISSTPYKELNELELGATTKFVNIAAYYSEYSSSNPITVDAYTSGDFDIVIPASTADLGVVNLKTDVTGIHEEISSINAIIEGNSTSLSLPGKDTKWVLFNFDVPRQDMPSYLRFGNAVTNGYPSGSAFWGIYADGKIIHEGSPKSRVVKGMRSTIPAGAKKVRLEIRYLSTETLTMTLEQKGLNEQEVDDVITRNEAKAAAVRAMGWKAVTTDIKPFAFMHLSDLHTSASDYKCFENACRFLENFTQIKCAVATGDLVYDTFADPMDYYNLGLEYTSKNVYNVIGNHDAGQYNASKGGLSTVGTDAQVYDKYIAPYLDRWALKTDGSGTPHPEGKSYYFTDFTDEKVRLIVLCEFESDCEISSTDSSKYKYSRECRAMRQAQVDWLIDSLSTTPSGYGVIVAHHQPDKLSSTDSNEFISDSLSGKRPAAIYASGDDALWLPKILSAFQKKQKLSFVFQQTGAVVGTINVACDFTSLSSSTELICTICGHTHNDFVGHLEDFPDIVTLVVGSDNINYTGRYCPRMKNTVTEDLFNVVNVDRNRKTITVLRVGAGDSATGQTRDKITINY